MSNVQVVKGHSRNPDHLGLCGVEKAQAAVIMRPPISAEQSLEGHVGTGSRVGADAATIICSLNLNLLLQQSKQLIERYTPATGSTRASVGDPISPSFGTVNPVSSPNRVGGGIPTVFTQQEHNALQTGARGCTGRLTLLTATLPPLIPLATLSRSTRGK